MTPFVLVVLALASYRVTVLVVKDWIPFGALREWIWSRWPYGDGDRVAPTKVGYLFTCQSCAGVWVGAGWYAAWRVWPSWTFAAGCAFALMAVQRTLGALVDWVESENEDT